MNILIGRRGYTGTTGRLLAKELEVEYVDQSTRPQLSSYKMCIRWGCTAFSGLVAEFTVNTPESIGLASRKDAALLTMQRAGVRVPLSKSVEELSADNVDKLLPAVFRTRYHQGGRGFALVNSVEEFLILGKEFTHGVQLIDKVSEWRVHSGDFLGRRLLIVQKKFLPEFNNMEDEVVWNFKNGWRFSTTFSIRLIPDGLVGEAEAAVKSLGLHFGAVDIVESRSGEVFVLEVNTAPGLTCPATQEPYFKFFKEVLCAE